MDSASACGAVDLDLILESGQTNDFNIGVHSFLACSAWKGQYGKQSCKFTWNFLILEWWIGGW